MSKEYNKSIRESMSVTVFLYSIDKDFSNICILQLIYYPSPRAKYSRKCTQEIAFQNCLLPVKEDCPIHLLKALLMQPGVFNRCSKPVCDVSGYPVYWKGTLRSNTIKKKDESRMAKQNTEFKNKEDN